jgi:hypothetical protein
MKSVFLVQHLHNLSDDKEDVKIIGIYRTKQAALDAIERLKDLPGFSDFPYLRDPLKDINIESGFYIDEHKLDEDSWTTGYVTVTY